MIKKILRRIFKKELEDIENDIVHLKKGVEFNQDRIQYFKEILGEAKVGVDVDPRGSSWAVVSIQGKRVDYVKFVSLGRRDAEEISRFLRNFNDKNVAVDCVPNLRGFIKSRRY